MQPNDPYTSQPTPVRPPQPAQPVQAAPQTTTTPKKHRKLALILLIGPTLLWVLAFIFTLTAKLIFPDSPATGDNLFGEPSTGSRIMAILSLLAGTAAFITWLPGIIIGTILLKKK